METMPIWHIFVLSPKTFITKPLASRHPWPDEAGTGLATFSGVPQHAKQEPPMTTTNARTTTATATRDAKAPRAPITVRTSVRAGAVPPAVCCHGHPH